MVNKQPNILLLSTDQLRLDALGCYGNQIIRTPNLDKIARQGVKFSNYFVQAPQCMTSRACILTGMYPRAHGLRRYGQSLSSDCPTLAKTLSDAGYHTEMIGKTHFYWEKEEPYLEPSYGFHSYQDRRLWKEYRKTKATDEEINRLIYNKKSGLKSRPHENPMPENATCDYWTKMKTIEFLNQYDSQKPFFMWSSFVNPHPPFNPPKRFIGIYSKDEMPEPAIGEGDLNSWQHQFYKKHWRLYEEFSLIGREGYKRIRSYYYSMITMLDEYIGEIIEALERNNLAKDTMIIFTSDHGDLMGDHGLCLKGSSHYDQIIHVPLLWYWSGHIEGGRVIDGIAEEVDLAPTFFDYASIQIPQYISGRENKHAVTCGIQGQSLKPMLDGVVDTIKDFAIAECYDEVWIKTLRSKKWSMSIFAGVDAGELYDMEKDPGQFNNLWFEPRYQEIRLTLVNLLFNRIFVTDPYPFTSLEKITALN